MNITEAIDALRPFSSEVPAEALDCIRANWSEAEPVLLKEIDLKLQSPTEEDRDALFLYAIHLCAEMRCPDAFPRYLRLCRLHDPVLHHVLGDVLTETMPAMLTRSCAGRVDDIKALAEDSAAGEYVRGSAMESLLELMLDGRLSRESLVEYCVFLFEKGLERRASHIWNSVIAVAADIHADAALPLIKKAYERRLADPGFERIEHILREFELPADEALERTRKRRRVFESTEEAMSFFVCQWGKRPDAEDDDEESSDLLGILKDRRRSTPAPQARKKTGRNDPCPCGSGKKYKKCCLNGPPKTAAPVSAFGKPVRDEHGSANDWMEAGYLYRDEHMALRVFKCWKRCWNELRGLLPEALKNPDDAEENGFFEGYDCLVNWLQDFEVHLADFSEKNVGAAEFSLVYFQELIDRFPAMDENMRSNIKADLARSMAVLGRHGQATDFLEKMIAETPRDPQSYVVLSEMYGWDAGKYGIPLDLPRAIKFLQDALNHAEDCKAYDVVQRLEALQEWKTEMETPLT